MPMVWHPYSRANKPKEFGWYLVTCPGTRNTQKCVALAWWGNDGSPWQVWNFNNGERMPMPTHWMPLPRVAR